MYLTELFVCENSFYYMLHWRKNVGKLMSDKLEHLSFTAKIQYIWEFYKLRITIVDSVHCP